jgi:hypothetical protein
MEAKGTGAEASSPELLDGWKEISRYLGRNARTCQRWEGEFGLPVYRIDPESPRAKVYAYRGELDQWRKSRLKNSDDASPKTTAAPRRGPRLAAFAAVLLVILAAAYLIRALAGRGAANPTHFSVSGSELVFLDDKENVLWKKNVDNPGDLKALYLPAPQSPQPADGTKIVSRLVRFKDVDGDGKNEVLAFLYDEGSADRRFALYDHDGKQIWEKKFDFPYAHREGPIVNDYVVKSLDFHDINGDGEQEVLVLWNHIKRFPSAFIAYTLKGEEIINYGHTGNFQFFKCVDMKAGTRIFLGGTNNLLGYDGVLAVLDGKKRVRGLGPPYEIPEDLQGECAALDKYVPSNPLPADQEHYFRFRRNRFVEALGTRILNVGQVFADDKEMEISVQYLSPSPVLVSLDPSGRIRGLNPGTAFRRAYELLRTEGKASLPLPDFLRECAKGITSWDGRTWIPAEYAGGLNPDSARR